MKGFGKLERDRIIWNVRQESAAGWFVGGLCFSVDNAECWDRESFYYPNEKLLKIHYPNSISMKEACEKAKVFRWIHWDWNR